MAIASVILIIISSVAGVVLTVWGRVTPPETRAAKNAFVALGILSVLCIIAAGVLNGVSQNRLENTIETTATNVQKLAETVKVAKNLSVDQILAAAASKLRQQDQEIQQLQSDVKGITHPSDALYLDNVLVARTVGAIQKTDAGVTFQLVVAGQNGLDFSREFQYRNLTLKCQQPGIIGSIGSFGVKDTRYRDLHCEIVPP